MLELHTGTQNSPAMYFSSTRVPAITSSVHRVGSSSRPVHRSSDVDFDEVPSPRRQMSALSNGRRSLASVHSPGPSRLSVATNPRDIADGLDIDNNFDAGVYNPPDIDESDNEPMASPSPSPSPTPSRRRSSFQQMDQDEEEVEEEQVEEEVDERTPTAKAKGKQRQRQAPQEEEPEASDGGFDEGNYDPPDIEEPQEPEPEPEEEQDRDPTPKPKKTRGKRNARDENAGGDDVPKPKRKRRDGILREGILTLLGRYSLI